MHDRPSDKPPTLFVRNFNSHLAASASVDALMEEYEAELNKPLPMVPRERTARRRSLSNSPEKRMQAKGLTRLPNSDISRTTTPLPAEEKPSGGFFRFGKSMASSFNPLNIFSKVASSWRDTKEEMVHEAREKRDLEDQKRLAEHTYAELKAAGLLGAQGTKPFVEQGGVFATGYGTAEPPSQRDSGIALDFESARSSMDMQSKPHMLPVPAFDSRRRPSLGHIRTPSLHDLKKVVSKIDLHKRSVSASRSRSPEKEAAESGKELRASQSKKDLQKQVKLSRRVSDLESKLDAARKELQNAIAVPPLPPLPLSLQRANRQNPAWKRYAPALPSLLSERLLTADGLDGFTDERDEDEMFGSVVANAQERPKTRAFSGDALYQQPNQPMITSYEFAPEAKTIDAVESVAEPVQQMNAGCTILKVKLPLPDEVTETARTKTTGTQRKSSENQTYRPSEDYLQDDSNPELSKTIAKRKRATEASASYKAAKPNSSRNESDVSEFVPSVGNADDEKKWISGPESAPEDSMREDAKFPIQKQNTRSSAAHSPNCQKKNTSFIDSDSDWEVTKPKTLKKRRSDDTSSSPRNSPRSQKNKATTSTLPVKKANVLTKTKPLPKPPVIIPEDVVLPQTALETVQEEMTVTSIIPLNGDPVKPTARATPAHPGRQYPRSRSRSPLKSPLGISVGNALLSTNNDIRSISSPDSIINRMMQTDSPDHPVIVRPGEKDVPPLPVLVGSQMNRRAVSEANKEEYEWDADIF
jgi:hypothetical protein